ncbi:hypothetical protein L1887_16819 [Cichorium endivia]|nr:hypothetical protein L1887_16819 [Cichorium endivia]
MARSGKTKKTKAGKTLLISIYRVTVDRMRKLQLIKKGCMKPIDIIPPIQLSSNTCMKKWLSSTVLIGEAHSLDHIGTFHSFLNGGIRTKYLGGLFLALEFESSSKAKSYLSDVNQWKDWFKVINPSEVNLRFERVAWLKIIGLPIPLWEEENFTKIVSGFGKVINPFDDIINRSDLSMGKVGIITSRRRWINEEVSVVADNKIFNVGVVEYTDDWSPFAPCSFDKVEEDETDGSEDESEGISDTWNGADGEDDWEEGEIKANNPGDHSVGGELPMEVESELVAKAVDSGDGSSPEMVDERSTSGIGEHIEDDKTVRDSAATTQSKVNVINRSQMGPIEDLVPSGCFGPFPSPIGRPNISSNNPSDSQYNTFPGGSGIKRKRTEFTNFYSLPIRPFSLVDQHHAESQTRIDSNQGGVDLNCTPQNPSSTDNSSQDKEVEDTVNVGVEVGFQIDAGNMILKEVMGVHGDHIHHQ